MIKSEQRSVEPVSSKTSPNTHFEIYIRDIAEFTLIHDQDVLE